MVLKNSFILFFIFFNILYSLEAKIILPELMAKQSISNIRFLSKDGKFTYYQKRSGSLLFSTNYKVQEMLKSEIGTQYTLIGTPAKKKIIILQNSNFHNFYSLRAKEKIYLLNYGDATPTEIGLGVNPKLLLNDSWLSFYDPYLKLLSFENTTNSALKFSVKLNNKINPYFLPQVLMSDEDTIYYTDLNEIGLTGLLEFKRSTGKSNVIFKVNSPMEKMEICQKNDYLLIGTFGIHNHLLGSVINKAPLPLTNILKKEVIYKSDLNDIGQLNCNFDNDHIFFIKHTGSDSNPSYDIAELNFSTKNIQLITDNHTVTNLIDMDGTLLTQEKGKYFIVKGDADFKSIDTLKQKTPPKDTAKELEKKLEKEIEDE